MDDLSFEEYAARLDALRASLAQPTEVATIATDKAMRVQQRFSDKQTRLGDNLALSQKGFQDPTTNILSSSSIRPIDADTYRTDDDRPSTRVLGIDTYESTKADPEAWLATTNKFGNLVNKERMDEQVVRLSKELGRPATYQDVFAAGDRQKQELYEKTTAPLPTLLHETEMQNLRPGDSKAPNYGRDLGLLQTLGGGYTTLEGEEATGVKPFLGDMDQALTDAAKYSGARPAESDVYSKLLDTPAEEEGRLGESIDMAQGAIAKFGADAVNMLTNVVGKENIAKYDAWAGELEKKLGGDGESGWFIGRDEEKSLVSMRDLQTAQKEFGVSEQTILDHNRAMKESEHMWETAKTPMDYIKSLAVGMSQLDRILAGSAGEIATLMVPGGPAIVAATRTSNYAEEFEKNNDKPMDKQKLAQTFFTELALLVPEKLLVKAGIGDIVKKTAKGPLAATGRIASAAVGEGLQEYGEGISEVVATQKEGERTLADIATDPKTVHQAAIGVGMGAGLKGTGEVLGVASDKVGGKVDKLATSLKAAASPEVPITASRAVKEAAEKSGIDEGTMAQTAKQFMDATDHDLLDVEYEDKVDSPVDTRAYTEVLAMTDKSKVATTKDIADAEALLKAGKDPKELTELANKFDDGYSNLINQLRSYLGEIKEDGTMGETYTPKLREVAIESINELQVTMNEAVAAGAGQAKQDLMTRQLQQLVPLAAAQTMDDLHSIMADDTINDDIKIANILGSSAAAVKDIDAALEYKDLSEFNRGRLEAKKKALTSKEVGKQKMFGGGAKLGVFQWAALMKEGELDSVARRKVKNFVDGQRNKLNKFKSALNTWDVENDMPWVKGSANTHNLKKFKGWTENQKANARSTVINDGKASAIEVKHNGKVFNDVFSIGDLVSTMQTEQDILEPLLATEAKTSQKAPKKPQESQKEVEQPTSPIKDKKAPEAAEEVLDTEEVARTKEAKAMASKDATAEDTEADAKELARRNKEAEAKAEKKTESPIPNKPAKLTPAQSVRWDKLVKEYNTRVSKLTTLKGIFASVAKIKQASRAIDTALRRLKELAAKAGKRVPTGAAAEVAKVSEVPIGGSETETAARVVAAKKGVPKTGIEKFKGDTTEDLTEQEMTKAIDELLGTLNKDFSYVQDMYDSGKDHAEVLAILTDEVTTLKKEAIKEEVATIPKSTGIEPAAKISRAARRAAANANIAEAKKTIASLKPATQNVIGCK